MPKKKITFECPVELVDQLDALCNTEFVTSPSGIVVITKVTRTDLIICAIRDYLKGDKENEKRDTTKQAIR